MHTTISVNPKPESRNPKQARGDAQDAEDDRLRREAAVEKVPVALNPKP